MPQADLRELYVDEREDLHSAQNKASESLTKKMAEAESWSFI